MTSQQIIKHNNIQLNKKKESINFEIEHYKERIQTIEASLLAANPSLGKEFNDGGLNQRYQQSREAYERIACCRCSISLCEKILEKVCIELEKSDIALQENSEVPSGKCKGSKSKKKQNFSFLE